MVNFEEEVYDYFEESRKAEGAKNRFLDNLDEMERFHCVINSIPNNVQNLLDVGCGHGFFLNLLQSKTSIKAIGLERAMERIKIARQLFQLNIIEGSVDLLPFKDQSFDAVTALEVIEHLPFGVYENALKKIDRVAREVYNFFRP